MDDLSLAPKAPIVSATHNVETVLWVKHWTDQYFSFAITRPASSASARASS